MWSLIWSATSYRAARLFYGHLHLLHCIFRAFFLVSFAEAWLFSPDLLETFSCNVEHIPHALAKETVVLVHATEHPRERTAARAAYASV